MSQPSTQSATPRPAREAVVSVRATGSGETIIHVAGPLTIVNGRDLQQPVADALDRGDRSVVVDLGDTGYIDSAALGTLVVLAKRLLMRGSELRELRLANVNDDLRAVLRLTALDTVLRIDGPEPTPGAPAAA
jgi:anti-anti-sigma factor